MRIEAKSGVARVIDAVSFGLLLAIVALSPLPFGSNFPEAMALLSGASGLLLFGVSLSLVVAPDPRLPVLTAPLVVAAAAFAAFGTWTILQAIPVMPAGLPHPLWEEGARALGAPSGERYISLDPQMTWAAFAKTFSYVAVGTSTIVLLQNAERRRLACAVLALAASLYAVYGIIGLADGDCCVLWLHKAAYNGVATGPFINRNNFAAYLGIAAIAGLAPLLREFGELRHLRIANLLRWLVACVTILFARAWPRIVALALLIAALLLTQSRAGIGSYIIAAGVLLILLSRSGLLGKRSRLLHAGLYAAVVVFMIAVFGGGVVTRIQKEGVEDAYRTQSWKIVANGIEASPWVGHGFGTFPEAFPLYRNDILPSRRFWDKAQNVYLELALDTGIPATLVLLTGFGALLVQCGRGLSRRNRERRIYPVIGIATTVLVAAHSIYDFPMQIPAIATTYAFLMGVALTESGIWRIRDQDTLKAEKIPV